MKKKNLNTILSGGTLLLSFLTVLLFTSCSEDALEISDDSAEEITSLQSATSTLIDGGSDAEILSNWDLKDNGKVFEHLDEGPGIKKPKVGGAVTLEADPAPSTVKQRSEFRWLDSGGAITPGDIYILSYKIKLITKLDALGMQLKHHNGNGNNKGGIMIGFGQNSDGNFTFNVNRKNKFPLFAPVKNKWYTVKIKFKFGPNDTSAWAKCWINGNLEKTYNGKVGFKDAPNVFGHGQFGIYRGLGRQKAHSKVLVDKLVWGKQ